MKKTIAVLSVITTLALPSRIFAQASILADNTSNSGLFGGAGGVAGNETYSTLVTQNGLIFTTDPAAQFGTAGNGGPAGNQKLGVDSSFVLVGGSSAAAVASITGGNTVLSWTGASVTGDNLNWGQLVGNSGTGNAIPGSTLAGTYFFNLFVWEGNTFQTFAAAQAGGDYTGSSGAFQNAAGGPNASGPPTPAGKLTGMPDMLLTVPEPSIFALAGLGAAALMTLRRRK